VLELNTHLLLPQDFTGLSPPWTDSYGTFGGVFLSLDLYAVPTSAPSTMGWDSRLWEEVYSPVPPVRPYIFALQILQDVFTNSIAILDGVPWGFDFVLSFIFSQTQEVYKDITSLVKQMHK
jgi:hypothetical protein